MAQHLKVNEKQLMLASGIDGGLKTLFEVMTAPGDIMGCYADNGKIGRDLRYRLQNDLIRGICSIVSWVKSL